MLTEFETNRVGTEPDFFYLVEYRLIQGANRLLREPRRLHHGRKCRVDPRSLLAHGTMNLLGECDLPLVQWQHQTVVVRRGDGWCITDVRQARQQHRAARRLLITTACVARRPIGWCASHRSHDATLPHRTSDGHVALDLAGVTVRAQLGARHLARCHAPRYPGVVQCHGLAAGDADAQFKAALELDLNGPRPLAYVRATDCHQVFQRLRAARAGEVADCPHVAGGATGRDVAGSHGHPQDAAVDDYGMQCRVD